MKFKEGDLVKVISKKYMHIFPINEVVKVVSADYEDGYMCEDECGLEQYLYREDMQLYTPNIDRHVKESKEDKVARLKRELEQAEKELSITIKTNNMKKTKEIKRELLFILAAKHRSQFF